MKEKNFQTEFGKRNRVEGLHELKLCKGTSIPFSALADHQEEALVEASIGEGLYHKITDQPIFEDAKTRFTKKKPFDCFYLKNQPCYVVVMFYKPRKKKNVYYITIQDWINMRKHADRKSATEAMVSDSAIITESYMRVK